MSQQTTPLCQALSSEGGGRLQAHAECSVTLAEINVGQLWEASVKATLVTQGPYERHVLAVSLQQQEVRGHERKRQNTGGQVSHDPS